MGHRLRLLISLGIGLLLWTVLTAEEPTSPAPPVAKPNAPQESTAMIRWDTLACGVHPDPVTPNGDGINELAYFTFPGERQGIRLRIYNEENKEVLSRQEPPYIWDGRNNDGVQVPNGLYLWRLDRGKEPVCVGTILLAR